MNIGIDARLIDETGVGRYIRNLISHLAVINQEDTFVVFLKRKQYQRFQLPSARWKKTTADVPWHSFTEQLVMPILLMREHLDIVHVPYFNIPIFYPKRFVVTVHDLIIHQLDTGRSSTLPYILYKVRRFGYRVILTIGLHRAARIIAVSQATKKDIVLRIRIPADKIDVIHEGIDSSILDRGSKESPVDGQYFLYVGNVYPHKNIQVLLQAYSLFVKTWSEQNHKMQCPRLVFVGKIDYFYRRLKDNILNERILQNVIFFGEANDSQLGAFYKYAEAIVMPSLIEGFGLPPLEALANNAPIIVSDINVFHETLGNVPLYFQPHNYHELSEKMMFVSNNRVLVRKRFEQGKSVMARYQWRDVALSTNRTYQEISSDLPRI